MTSQWMLDHVRDSFLDGSMTEIQELAVSSCLEGVGATEIGKNIFQQNFTIIFPPRFVTLQNCENSCQHKIQMFEVFSIFVLFTNEYLHKFRLVINLL